MKVENKTDDQLKRGQSRYEIAAQASGLGIVAGLLVEAWLAVKFRPIGAPFSQTWGPVFGDGLIALSVFFELMFGRWALRHAGELQQRTEKSLADLTKQLIKLRTARTTIIAGKEAVIAEKLSKFTNISFDTAIGPNDKEVEDFLWVLEPILWNAKWRQIDWKYNARDSGVNRGTSGRPLIGYVAASNISIQILDPPRSTHLMDAAAALVAVLAEIDIDAQIDGFNIHNANPSAMHILVGPKR